MWTVTGVWVWFWVSTLERLRRIWMEKVMTSMQGTLLLQLRMSVKMTTVAPLSTSRSQHTGDSLVAVSENQTHSPLLVSYCKDWALRFWSHIRLNCSQNRRLSTSLLTFIQTTLIVIVISSHRFRDSLNDAQELHQKHNLKTNPGFSGPLKYRRSVCIWEGSPAQRTSCCPACPPPWR